ncbi:MAG: lysophospholipid acyltransferase family protein [Pyrinomonadaceae bacterium]
MNSFGKAEPFRTEGGKPLLLTAFCSSSAILLVVMQASAEQEFKGARAADETIARAYKFADLSSYPAKKRFLIRAADLAFFLLIKLIGRTIRWQVEGWENWEAATRDGLVPIYTFWHNRVFLATYFWQKRRIVVMTSQSFDGEYIARFIQRFGYGAARGSSTRGAVGAIIEMTRLMRAGSPTAFTIDGPKGPRYVAKMGAVLLAKKTGQPILPFTITAQRFWEAKQSWDGFQVPLPFSRARVDIAEPIYVSADANDEELEAKRSALQAALDDMNRRGKEWVG